MHPLGLPLSQRDSLGICQNLSLRLQTLMKVSPSLIPQLAVLSSSRVGEYLPAGGCLRGAVTGLSPPSVWCVLCPESQSSSNQFGHSRVFSQANLSLQAQHSRMGQVDEKWAGNKIKLGLGPPYFVSRNNAKSSLLWKSAVSCNPYCISTYMYIYMHINMHGVSVLPR